MAEEVSLINQLEARDKAIRKWLRETRKDLKQQIDTYSFERPADEDSFRKNLRTYTKKVQGEIENIGFRFPRHAIFIEHGVGRGRPKGSSQALEMARPWLKPVLPKAVEKLADEMAESYADIATESIVLRIPGIINTKVKG
jgi:hypothetical protein